MLCDFAIDPTDFRASPAHVTTLRLMYHELPSRPLLL